MSNSKTLFSRDYFYKSHQNEISKYITQDTNYINIFNKNSKFPKEYFNNVLIEMRNNFQVIESGNSKKKMIKNINRYF